MKRGVFIMSSYHFHLDPDPLSLLCSPFIPPRLIHSFFPTPSPPKLSPPFPSH